MTRRAAIPLLLIATMLMVLFGIIRSGDPDRIPEMGEFLPPHAAEGAGFQRSPDGSVGQRKPRQLISDDQKAPRSLPDNQKPAEDCEVARFAVFGTVRSRSGESIVGATVRLEALPLPVSTKTDRSGSYRLQGRWSYGTRIPRLVVLKRGFLPAQKGFPHTWLAGKPEAIKRDFVLGRGSSIRGRVLHGRSPVPGARILLVPDESLQIPGRPGQSLWWTSASGNFFCEVKPGLSYTLFINNGRYGNATRHALASLDDSYVDLGDIRLSPVHSLIGRISYPNGEGIGDLALTVSRVGKTVLDAGLHGALFGMTRTGPNGFFALDGLVAGDYKIIIPAAMCDSLHEARYTLSTKEDRRTLVLPVHRIRASISSAQGVSLSPDRVTIQYEEILAPRSAPTCKRYEPKTNQIEKADRLVTPGSRWKLHAEWMKQSVDTAVVTLNGRNETKVRIKLVDKR